MRIPNLRRVDVLRAALGAAAALVSSTAIGQVVVIPPPPNPAVNNVFASLITGIGDVDGDGFGDLLSGNYDEVDPDHPPGQQPLRAGAVHVFSGRSGQLIRTLRSPMMELHGLFGFSRSGIEDLNEDLFPEILVGAYFERSTYLFSGSVDELLSTIMAPPEYNGAYFGISVVSLSDTDADGFQDIAVGAGGEDSERGAAYIFSGHTQTFHHRLVSPSPQIGGVFGHTVARLADVDGDAAGDLAVVGRFEASSVPSRGRVHVFSGATGAFLYTVDSPYGPCGFAHDITALEDIDGDGRGDFAVSAPFCHPPGTPPLYEGVVHVYSGATGARMYSIISPAVQISGQFGARILGTPDLNGDGWPELLVAAPRETPPGFPPNHGRVYIFAARTGTLLRTFVSPDPTPIEGRQFGTGIAVVPDASNDGRADLAIGSYDCASVCPPTTFGAIYIFHSCKADYNYDGRASVQDLFDFLSAWFTPAPDTPRAADFNRDGSVGTLDVFAFIAAWFEGCPP